jgi:aryl-alcohol dehydrogenase-like predicted oxidoreductase
MKYKQLGTSDMKASVVGMGCWAIGGTKWGRVDEEDSVKAINKALELGVNFFDTADFYGFGHSEELLGKVIKKNNNVFIATKVGLRWSNKGKISHDLSRDYIKKACENSLKRLGRETIDLYQIHWPDPDADFLKTTEYLDELVREGKVRYIGACNLVLEQIKVLSNYPWFVSYQGLFNLFKQKVKNEILPYCYDKKIGFIAYEPLFEGLLTGKFKKKPEFEKGDHRKYKGRFTANFPFYNEKVKLLSIIAAEYKITEAQMALALLLKNKEVTIVIPGAKTNKQVEENVMAANISDELAAKLEEEVKGILIDV